MSRKIDSLSFSLIFYKYEHGAGKEIRKNKTEGADILTRKIFLFLETRRRLRTLLTQADRRFKIGP